MSQNINEPVPGTGGVANATGPFDRAGTVFASQVRSFTGASGGTASGVYNSQEFYNPTAKGVRLNLVIAPTGAATGTVLLKVQVPSPAPDSTGSTVWTDLTGTSGGFAAVNGTGALTGVPYLIYPRGIADSTGAMAVVDQPLGPRWRVVATVGLAALTFTVGADYLL
jgi:hypothetical protein